MSQLGAQVGVDLDPNNAALNQNSSKIQNLEDEINKLKTQLEAQSKYTTQLEAQLEAQGSKYTTQLEARLEAQGSKYTSQLEALQLQIGNLNNDSSVEGFLNPIVYFYVLLIHLFSFVQDRTHRTYLVWCLLLAVCFFFISLVREMPSATIKSTADAINDIWNYETKSSLLYLTALRGKGSSVTVQLRNSSTSQRNQKLL